jgi:malate synthase
MDVFNAAMPSRHQIHKKRQTRNISDAAMLVPHTGTVTEAGVRTNINVGIRYIAAWLCGRGAVPIHNLMEDAATAEISRTQIWQWLRHDASVEMEGGFKETMTERLYERLFAEEISALQTELGEAAFETGRFPEAAEIFTQTATGPTLPDFLTIPAYDLLEQN